MDIQRVGAISHREFMREFYGPGIPVIFTEAASAWQAKGLFTPAWLAKRFGERTTDVRGQSYSMREVVNLLNNSTAGQPAPYPCIFDIPGELPELLPLLQPLTWHTPGPTGSTISYLIWETGAGRWNCSLEARAGASPTCTSTTTTSTPG